MPDMIWVVLGGAVVLVIARLLFSSNIEKLITAVAKGGDPKPLLAALAEVREGKQPDEYNRVIRGLWDDYNREEAVPVIKALAITHGAAPIAQYWIQQVREVEPDLARRFFDEDFINANFKPEVAATCGKVG